MSFGVLFGSLIRQLREDASLSAGELALRAFGDEAKRSRISELENGKVKNPQAKTITALAKYFDLNAAQIEALRQEKVEVTASLQVPSADINLPQELLENLAQRFGIDNPNRPPAALSAFLKQKAEEFNELKSATEALPQSDERVANIRAAAEDAIERGDFDEARARLDDAIEIEIRDHALVSASKVADMLELKAKSYLLEGDSESAAATFTRAAKMVAPFDELEGARRSFLSGFSLNQHGLRYGGIGVQLAIKAFEESLTKYTKQDQPLDWAATHNNLGIALSLHSNRMAEAESIELFQRAVMSYEAALTIFTKQSHPADWATTQDNLARTLSDQSDRHNNSESVKLLTKAIIAYEEALTVRTKQIYPADWAMTQNNLAIALANQGNRLGGAEGVKLLTKAITAYESSLIVFTKQDYPVQWAMTQSNLAVTFADQANKMGGAEGVELLTKAVNSYEAALTVRTKQDHPVSWAETNENIALAYEGLSAIEDKKAKQHLKQALHHVDESLTIYDSDHMPYRFEKATKLRDHIIALLAALD